jgi:hypothetical protein
MSEHIQITNEHLIELVRHVKDLTNRIAALEQPKNQDSDWYIERVKTKKTVCEGCINAFYTVTNKKEQYVGFPEKVSPQLSFEACLLSAGVTEVHQCSQFVFAGKEYTMLKD